MPTLSVQGVYVFLGGIKSLNDSVSLNYISSFDSVKGIVSINISFGQAHVAVEYVKVFYVIILTAPFGSSLISGLSTLGDYAFSAANGMTNGNCNIVTVSIDMQHYSCLSPSCPYQCLFKSACLDDGGTIVGKNCIICSKDQLFNHNTQTCGCPNNFYQFGDSCKPCWANSKSSLDSTTCVCLTGFTQTGESCV